MATRVPVVRRGDSLLPANEEAREKVRSMKQGHVMAADIVQLRNPLMHRKAFAYLQLAFDYFQPKNLITTAELATVKKLSSFLANHGMDADTTKSLCREFLSHLNNVRKGSGIEFAKNFEAFRQFVTVEAGYYNTVITPAGPRREAKSWAYVNMSEAEFQELFAAIRNVCWNLILSQEFNSIEDADAAAEQLMTFD